MGEARKRNVESQINLPLHYRRNKSGMLKYKEKDEKLGKGLK